LSESLHPERRKHLAADPVRHADDIGIGWSIPPLQTVGVCNINPSCSSPLPAMLMRLAILKTADLDRRAMAD